MKKETFIHFFITILFIGTISVSKAQTVEDANVYLSNLSSNSYWNSYDDNTKMISGLNFRILADGSNSSYVTPSFTIKVYIYDGSNPHYVKTFNDPGIYHYGSKDYTNESVDLSGLSLPAGTYQLGVYVDADDNIPNPPDDPNDNAYLLSGDIDFTPGSGTNSIEENQSFVFTVYPNPTVDVVNIKWNNSNQEDKVNLKLCDLQGKVIRQIAAPTTMENTTIDISDLAKGTYIITAQSASGLISRKITKR